MIIDLIIILLAFQVDGSTIVVVATTWELERQHEELPELAFFPHASLRSSCHRMEGTTMVIINCSRAVNVLPCRTPTTAIACPRNPGR